MLTVRLNASTIAIRQHEDGSRSAIIIPAGARLSIKDAAMLSRRVKGPNEKVSVEWEGSEVRVFLMDLRERGERMESGGPASS